MQTTSSQRMLSAAEIAVRLDISRATVYRLAEAGLIPGKRIGIQWRFDHDELEGWLAQNR